MQTSELISVGLYGATSGAAALAIFLVGRRRPSVKAYQAMVGFFACVAVNAAANMNIAGASDRLFWTELLKAPFLASFAPFLLLSVEDLVSDRPLAWRWRDLLHFSVAAYLALCAFTAVLLRAEPDTGQLAPFVTVGTLAMLGQCTVYLALTLRMLTRLRPRLMQVFASTDTRELAWLRLTAWLIGVNWAMTVAYNLGVWQGSDLAFSSLGFVTIVLMALYSATQRPAFQADNDGPLRLMVPVEGADEFEGGGGEPNQLPKYSRSLLDETRLKRISAKITTAFSRDLLYRDPNLSLRKLSEHTSVPESQLSQTFTRKHGTSFYGYVNQWRIDEAKERLLDGEANVLDIALQVGFNSRSAFYRAFKETTGLAPATFRKTPQLGENTSGEVAPGAAVSIGPHSTSKS